MSPFMSPSESNMGKTALLIILILISLVLIVGVVRILERSKTPDAFQADPVPVVKNMVTPIVVPTAPSADEQPAYLNFTIPQGIVNSVVPIPVSTPPTFLMI